MPSHRRPIGIALLLLVVAVVVVTGISPVARAQIVVATIEMGASGRAVAVNPTTHRVYVSVDGKIKVYDSVTHAWVADISLPQNYVSCYDLAVNPVTNRIYATGFRTYVIDGNNHTVLLNSDKTGRELAVNPATNLVYVGSLATSPYSDPYTVHVLNGADNTWLPDVVLGTVGTFEYVHVGVNPNTNRVYVAFTGDDDLRALDGASHAEVGRLHLSGIGPLAVNPTTNKVYVRSTYEGAVVVDGASHTQVGAISRIGGTLRLNALTNRIYGLASRSSGWIVQVADGAVNRVVENVYLDGNLEGYATDDALGKLFAAYSSTYACCAKKMAVIQDASPTSPAPQPVPGRIAVLDLPENGDGVAVNTVTQRLYVGVKGGLVVFDPGTLAQIGTISLATASYSPTIGAVGVDENLNRIYAVSGGQTYVIAGADGRVIGNLAGGDSIAVNPANARVYIADDAFWLGDPDLLYIYDGATQARIRRLSLGTYSTYKHVYPAVNPTTGVAYCAYTGDGNLRIISPLTDDVTQTLDYVSVGRVVVNQVTNRVYASATRGGQSGLVVLDGDTHAEVGMFVGLSGVFAVNQQSNRLYATSSSTLFRMLDASNGALLGRAYVDGGIYDVAVHPGLARLYATHSSSPTDWARKVSVIQDTGGPPPPTATPTATPTTTATPRPWPTPSHWLYLPLCSRR